MMGLSLDELDEVEASDMAIYVESGLMYQRDKDDFLLESLSQFTAQIMMSGGNMKKSTKPEDIAENLHKNIYELIKQNKSKDELKEEATEEKDKLMKRFELQNE